MAEDELQPDGVDVGTDHDWHTFDEPRGMEVSRAGHVVYVRFTSAPDEVTVLTVAEFEQLRAAGPNPKGL